MISVLIHLFLACVNSFIPGVSLLYRLVLFVQKLGFNWSLIIRKPVFSLCEQQRRRSTCASAQSDQRLYCSLPGQYNASTCYSRSFKTLACFCSSAGRFESYLVENPEDRFSCDGTQLFSMDPNYKAKD